AKKGEKELHPMRIRTLSPLDSRPKRMPCFKFVSTVQSFARTFSFALAGAMLTAFASDLAAQFIYVNNNDLVNTVSGFSTGPDGSLTLLQGFPKPTGGSGDTRTNSIGKTM